MIYSYLLYWPRFILLSLVTFATSLLLARAIACESRHRENGPMGSGRPFWGFNSLKSTSLLSSSLSISPPAAKCYFRTVKFFIL